MAVRQPTLSGVPGKSPFGGYVYVIRFSIDVIKVGASSVPAARLHAHHSYSRGLGIAVTDQWVSEPHAHVQQNEAELIKFCNARATQANAREYFAGLSFSEVTEFARTLPYVPVQDGSAPCDAAPAPRWRQIYAVVEERIANGTYPPGSQLPGVLALQGEFGVAQMTARRVLTELRAAGLAQMQPGVGTFVTELPKAR